MERSFEILKEKLCNVTALKLPDFNKQFYVSTDASDNDIGGMLFQDDGPIAFYSRKLSSCELNYSKIDREYLVLFSTIRKFHGYLYGVKFKAYTDHKPLVNFLKNSMQSGRQQRWFTKLEEYDFDLIYVKGKDNVVADYLSRQSCNAFSTTVA